MTDPKINPKGLKFHLFPTDKTGMKATQLKWTKLTPGRYEHITGDGNIYEICSIHCHTEGESSERGWILFAWKDEDDQCARDGYCGHHPSLKSAKASVLENMDWLCE